MKIVLITHHFPPNFNAGAEQYAYRIAKGLYRQGQTIEVVCIESITDGSLTPVCETDSYEGLTVHRLHFDVRQAPNLFEWSFRNPELGHWTRDFLQRTRPEVVHINSGYLLGGTVPEAARELGIPTVLTLHDYWFMCPYITLLRTDAEICDGPVSPARCVWCSISQKRRYGLLDKRLGSCLGDAFVRFSQSKRAITMLGVAPQIEMVKERRAYLKQILDQIDLVIAPSQFAIHKHKEYRFAPPQVVYLPFGLDKTHLSGPEVDPLPSKLRTELRIGYLGQFAVHKGVHLLLAAFRRMDRSRHSCKLILHGNLSGASPYERKLLKIAHDDPDIIVAGPYPNAQVGQVLNGLDAIVVPSIWYENRPTVILEAHATGTPVVAARLGGMAELLRHGENGLLFEVGDVKDLARQLQRLLDEPMLLSRLRKGIQPVPTVEQETATLVSLYESLLPAPENAKPRSLTQESQSNHCKER